MLGLILRWIAAAAIAFCIGKGVSKLKLPAILGWLIAGMILGPYALHLLPQTLIPMAALDDMVGVAVFFTTVAVVARHISGSGMPLYMIPVMILLPLLIGLVTGFPAGKLLKKENNAADAYHTDWNDCSNYGSRIFV